MSDKPQVRVRRRRFQTATHYWKHPATGRRVTVIGTIHIATYPYYASIVGDAAGASAVAYELIDEAPQEQWDEATDAEHAALAAWDSQTFVYRGMREALGLAPQQDAINPAPAWVNTDMTDLEFIRLLGPEYFIKNAADTAAIFGEATPAQMAAVSPLLLRFIRLAGIINRHSGSGDGEVILARRNRIALEHALGQADGDLVMLWGAGHLEGIGEGLAAAGYVRERVSWRTAFVLPRAGIARGLRVLGQLLGSAAGRMRDSEPEAS